jgi:hypothetical protein
VDVSRATLELRIDELVVDGFRPLDRGAVSAAVNAELRRLLGERGIPASLGRTRHVGRRGSAVRVSPAGGAEELGAAIGASLYEVLGR